MRVEFRATKGIFFHHKNVLNEKNVKAVIGNMFGSRHFVIRN